MKQIGQIREAGVWAGNSFETFDALGGKNRLLIKVMFIVMMFRARVFPPLVLLTSYRKDPRRVPVPILASF